MSLLDRSVFLQVFVSLSLSLPVLAADVLTATDVSTITAIDTDGDGLTNTEEASMGTSPSATDTDGDGYNDAVDTFPIDSDNPDLGSSLYEFNNIQRLTTGASTHELSPVFLLGGKVAYVEADSNFANGSLFKKNIYQFADPRAELLPGLSAELREFGAAPLGDFIYFHQADPLRGGKTSIYKVDSVGNVTRAVPGPGQTLPEDVSVRNPSLAADVEIVNGTLAYVEEWLFCEGDFPSATQTQIYALRLQTSWPGVGDWDDTVAPVQITQSNYKLSLPKVSRDLDKLMVRDISGNVHIFHQLRDILEGITNSYVVDVNFHPDLRGDGLANGPTLPGGWGEGLAFYSVDVNNDYDLNDPLNFSNTNFNIQVTTVGVDSNGRFTKTSPLKTIPLPGNQIMPAVSPSGMSLVFADDYLSDGVPGGTFDLYALSVRQIAKIRDRMNSDTLNNVVVLPNGTFVDGNIPGHEVRVPGGAGGVLSAHSDLKPVADAATLGSALTSIEIWGPSGLYVEDTGVGGTPGLYLKKKWDLYQLLTEDGSLLDETEISIGWNVVSGAGTVYTELPEEYILERDLTNREIRYIAPHFSEYGLIAPKLIPVAPSSVENWSLQE